MRHTSMQEKKGNQLIKNKEILRRKKIRKKKTAVQGATDVPNFPQDQVSEDWQRKSGKSASGGLNEKVENHTRDKIVSQ